METCIPLDAPEGLDSARLRTVLTLSIRKVIDALGSGRRESVYQCALKHELQKALGKVAVLEYPIPIFYEGERVGVSYLDILVTKLFFLEIKATSKIGGVVVRMVRMIVTFTLHSVLQGF